MPQLTAKNAALIWNESKGEHQTAILDKLAGAKRFACMVAYAKPSGLRPLKAILERRLTNKMKSQVVVSLDFSLTDPAVLEQLLIWSETFGLEAYVKDEGSAFHPKMYEFETDDSIFLLVGSANLTLGGLSENYESSILVELPAEAANRRVQRYVKELADDQVIEPLTKKKIQDYKPRFDAAVASRLAQKLRQTRLAKSPTGKGSRLSEVLNELRRDSSPAGFSYQVALRRRNLRTANTILRTIGGKSSMTKAQFEALYDKLVLHLWHSGGLFRGKTAVASRFNAFRALVRYAIVNHRLPIDALYQTLTSMAKSVGGVGPNILTEILHTLDHKKFSVMNKNSVNGIRIAGYGGFPERPSKGSVSGNSYATFCACALEIRNSLKLTDFGELDTVFNHLYWNAE